MAYDPDLGGLGSQWLDQILGGPMTGYGAALGGQMTGAAGGYLGTGGLPTFQGFGGASPLAGIYGGGAPAAYSGYQSPIQSLYQNYQFAPMASYPALQAFMAPPQQMAPTFLPPPQGVGGYGSALASTYPGLQFGQFGAQQYSPQQGGGQQYGGQPFGGAQQYSGLGGQQYGQQPARGQMAGTGQQYGQQQYGQRAQPAQAGAPPASYAGGAQQARAAPAAAQPAGAQQAAGGTRGGLFPQIVDGGIIGAPDHDGTMTDWFAPGGSQVKAPVGGTIVSSGSGYFGGIGLRLQGDDGAQWEMRHVQGTAQPGQRVQAGQPVATIQDASLPASYQHVDIRRNGAGATPMLRQAGAQARTQATSGPSQGGDWMSRGPLGGGSAGGMQSGFGGMNMGLGYGQQQQGGFPFAGIPGMQGGFGGGQQGGFNLMSMLGGGQQGGFGGFGQQFGGFGGFGR